MNDKEPRLIFEVLLYLDACNSGSAIIDFKAWAAKECYEPIKIDEDGDNVLKLFDEPLYLFIKIFAACGPDEKSFDAGANIGGLFTKAFTKFAPQAIEGDFELEANNQHGE